MFCGQAFHNVFKNTASTFFSHVILAMLAGQDYVRWQLDLLIIEKVFYEDEFKKMSAEPLRNISDGITL